MARATFLNSLFDAHLRDLTSVAPAYVAEHAGDVFVCPICLEEFHRIDIEQRRITDGHVWPRLFRENNRIASEQRVLLCSKCNHEAGSHGDSHMQLFEHAIRESKTGVLRRKFQILQGLASPTIVFSGSVFHQDGKILRVEPDWQRSDPQYREAFRRLRSHSRPITLVVPPKQHLQPSLARAGWLTSAYLMAFFCFGYRYVLNSSLGPIRGYIQTSFTSDFEGNAGWPPLPDVDAWRDGEDCTDPSLRIMLPLDKQTPIHLQVCYGGYYVSLPIFPEEEALNQVVLAFDPGFFEHISEYEANERVPYVPVLVNKSTPAITAYDYVLGKPISQE